jgi:hypothetical protein
MSRCYPGKVSSREDGENGRPMALVRLAPPAVGYVLVRCPSDLTKGARVWVRPTGCPMSDPWALAPKLILQQASLT